MRTHALTVAMCAMTIAGPTAAAVIHVPDDYPTIKLAIDAAEDFDQIFVAPGTYVENLNIDGKHLSIEALDGPDVTTIQSKPNAGMVLRWSNTTGSCLLSGFTITGGSGPSGAGLSINNVTGSFFITSCIITFNVGSQTGGGLHIIDSDPVWLVNTVIVSNNAPIGPGATIDNSTVQMLNCTVAFNSTGGRKHPVLDVDASSSVTIRNSIISHNSAPHLASVSEQPLDIQWSTVQGGYEGVGNIADDPLFASLPPRIDLRLTPGSPSIDAGRTHELVACGGGYIGTDVIGQTRVVDEPDTPNTGTTLWGITVDMGAYEHQPAAPDACAADLNQSGAVNAADLALLLGAWGACR